MRFKFTFGFGGKRTVKCSCGATRYYGEPCDYCDVPDTYVPRSGEIFRSPNTPAVKSPHFRIRGETGTEI